MIKFDSKGLEKAMKDAATDAFKTHVKKIVARTTCPEHHKQARATFTRNGEVKLQCCCESLKETIMKKISK